MNEATRALRAERVKVTCPCGAVFETLASKVARGHGKFCSRACFFASRTGRRSEYIWVECPCGTKFETLASRVAAGHGQFCSRKCRARYGKRKPYVITRPNPAWFTPKPEAERQTPEEARAKRAISTRRWKQQNPDKVKAQCTRYLPEQKVKWLRRAHGLTPDGLKKLFKAQRGCCYLCGSKLSPDMKGVHIDHDHRCCPSGKSCVLCRRGLACLKCNVIAGLASDDPDLLRKIARNLEAANGSLGLVGSLSLEG